MLRSYVPESGDAIWLSFDPHAGHEQAGTRPAVVLSPASYNGRVGLALVCPITNQVKGYPFEVVIPQGLEARGVVFSDQVKSLDWRTRNAQFACKLPRATIDEIFEKLLTLLT